MSDHGSNGAIRISEFDLVADLRKEVDEGLRAVDRRIGIVETSIRDRLDMLATKVDRSLQNDERIFGELKTLADYIVRVLDRTMDVEKRMDAREDGSPSPLPTARVVPISPRRKAGKK
jgi:hypothetical protein